MKTNNLGENLKTILQNKYIVPLYQRNFAWGEEEISQLLQDIYESFRKNESGNYYIGSLVVMNRKNGDYEVIDGQQRLTAITLISKILKTDIKEPKLFYDSRPEVEAFFNSFYQSGKTDDVTFDYKVSHLINAIDYIKNAKLNSDDSKNITIETLAENFDNFKNYFFNNVILVFVELPTETDVANYFEIMNNRGQQLQKHDILKAKLLDKIKKPNGEYDLVRQKIYSRIWNACSQMNEHIQKLFNANDRKILFGDNYDEFPSKKKIEKLLSQESLPQDMPKNKASIEHILSNYEQKHNNNKTDDIDDIDDEGDDKSIIDFPNFLMCIFKLNSGQIDIPLNEKYLLDEYENRLKNSINAEDFISDLLYYRTIFDRYIVKATTTEEHSEDKFKWTLKQAYRYEASLKYKNTFDNEQERIVKCLSMLQVTFRTRIYKNWLQEVLSWFKENETIAENNYRKKLDEFVLTCYTLENEIDNYAGYYSQGTNTPHFLFNFIDYLYWTESKNDINKPQFKFDFRYRNSVEHHLPQSFEGNSYSKDLIDNLGNLCLVSKSSNSRMNNESPKGKADKNGKYYDGNLTPKRKKMYDTTNDQQSWGEKEIKQHYSEVKDLLKRRIEILNVR